MLPSPILVVEDEFIIADNLQDILESNGWGPVLLAVSVEEALAHLAAHTPRLVLLDIMLAGPRSGIELGTLLRTHYHLPFIYITSHADKQTLQQAVATQPHGYILKPFQEEEILAVLDQVLATTAPPPAPAASLPDIVSQSAAIQDVLAALQLVAPHPHTVLITGETGTGKELFARALHAQSGRPGPLVTVNCAALPSQLIESELFGHEKGAFTGAVERRVGKFELADGGTLFLDEVGELPLELQAKLLRVLQEKEFERVGGRRVLRANVRVLAATNRVLEDEVQAGRFRQDLYYRLNVFPLPLPPLRHRPDDIEPLAELFLRRAAAQLRKPLTGFSAAMREAMRRHPWPGNVRELQHVVERAALLATTPLITDLRLEPTAAPAVPEAVFTPRTLEDAERELIRATLQHCNGRIRGAGGAAEYLRILPTTLDARIRKLGIQKEFTTGRKS
ncbi:sigma-54-dependent transcriptional regulator [Hymenobacter weizhouensis]|uniref:sigma-54-dependent transcriptional regulator n=1 Tax=Hymenobacter sp. YIM 151500-1 TaxID=2987689 RepID=UPI0022276D89|nr:sigma-54 dependent transcriptional regulator [Hymenobacter sp. YIM 151500-1]UYZ61737.1 sigma-54 dependent transcriptional regulator [Hymenobacter sp. YIM 151500-1]